MKKAFLFTLCATIFLNSCTLDGPTSDEQNTEQALELKEILDHSAIELREPSLCLTVGEISLALTGQPPLAIQADRIECNDYNFKRSYDGETDYEVNILTIVGQILPVFGNEVETYDPRDVSVNGFIDVSDLMVLLSYFGNEFEAPALDEVDLVGGEVSGTGELANFSGPLIIENDTVQILSIYKGSNCFVQDYNSNTSAFDQCNDQTILTFATASGVVKYTSIN